MHSCSFHSTPVKEMATDVAAHEGKQLSFYFWLVPLLTLTRLALDISVTAELMQEKTSQ